MIPGLVGHAFGLAEAYDRYSHLQTHAGRTLLAGLPAMPVPARLLEIGCGPGTFTRLLRQRWPASLLVCSDLSPAMVDRCRANGWPGQVWYLAMDAEQPAVAGGFDLVIANMAVQWFRYPGASLARLHGLLAPGGLLAFSTLGPGTLAEWRTACRQVDLPCPTPRYPDAQDLQTWLPGCTLVTEQVVEPIASPMAFFHALRALGATRALGQNLLPPGRLRRALACMACQVSWELYYGYAIFS